MGISSGALPLLIREGLRRPFKGSVLTLGKQDAEFTIHELYSHADRAALPIERGLPEQLSLKSDLAEKRFVSDEFVFKTLGFNQVTAVDVNDFEGAEMLHDLNQAPPPSKTFELFDFIFDGGTLEHIYHIPNALECIFSWLCVNGRVLHLSPSSNTVDHGFYSFSPTFFYDYYSANNFEINCQVLIKFQNSPNNNLWWYCDYTPGCLDQLGIGGLDSDVYFTSIIATKLEISTCNRIPQQGYYKKLYS
ncbi:MAG: hypothetical protein R6X10_06870 [Desulfobacterales bacterium]